MNVYDLQGKCELREGRGTSHDRGALVRGNQGLHTLVISNTYCHLHLLGASCPAPSRQYKARIRGATLGAQQLVSPAPLLRRCSACTHPSNNPKTAAMIGSQVGDQESETESLADLLCAGGGMLCLPFIWPYLDFSNFDACVWASRSGHLRGQLILPKHRHIAQVERVDIWRCLLLSVDQLKS